MHALSRLSESNRGLIQQIAEELDPFSLNWLSGYLAGVAQVRNGGALTQPTSAPELSLVPTPAQKPATIIFGSQTGNAQRVAQAFAQRCEAAGIAVRLLRADRYPTRELKDERLLYIVISTQGEGDPPDDSIAFFEFLSGARAPKLPALKYGVLGLGDSSYPLFCGIAEKIDQRLQTLGAQRLQDTGLADLDIDTVAGPWQDQAFALLDKDRQAAAPTATSNITVLDTHARGSTYSREKPFQATVLQNQSITARDSTRDIRHYELSLEGSGLSYQPGDALGVWPTQNETLVQAVIQTLQLDPQEPVTVQEHSRSLQEWLRHYRELTQLTKPFLLELAKRNNDPALQAAVSPDGLPALQELLGTHQVLDVLKRFPAAWTAGELVAALRPLAPRMYSIASSQSEVDEEVHLTVANVQYQFNEQDRWGVASDYLARLAEGDTVPVFVDPNTRFRLPEDTSRDVIMIGPGTGVAPFRAFVQERSAQGGDGRNWLFFGNPHFHSDFLYQTEWQRALQDGQLHQLDLAFSRDQQEKIYVQHRLLEKAADIYAWIQGGAHIYVCGDASRMAKDVHQALQEIARRQGGLDAEQARAWLEDLSAQGRYARDVY
ncbi:assimilatory sulfite reductase (NADPH) flavoprotein subunit [Alcaligenes sp. SDU_A2]|uniref:assimilatory sulfite reductase (NADPH) flavoprotein subunit n=1 Tax=Alcaligenes sp. SDU_A2 TaxID=3136634 RepID=UPI00311E4FE9